VRVPEERREDKVVFIIIFLFLFLFFFLLTAVITRVDEYDRG
jgi:hypothetical protein